MNHESTPPPSPSPPPSAAAASPAEQRVSTIVGDRLCIRCGYNLVGQFILREPHYNMLVARCPECGAVTGVQEYPLLGRWANRWAVLIAALWLITIIGMAVITSLTMYGVNRASIDSASTKYAMWLAQQQLNWHSGQPVAPTGPNAWIAQQGITPYSAADPTWWKAQDPAALFATAGGWRNAINWDFLWNWANVSPVLFAFGCFWAVALLKMRRLGLLGFAGGVVLTAVVFEIIFGDWSFDFFMWGSGWIPMMRLAGDQLRLPITVMTFTYCFVALSLGLMLGRPLARGLIRFLLPPRLRGSLAILWIEAGKTPPIAGGSRFTRASR